MGVRRPVRCLVGAAALAVLSGCAAAGPVDPSVTSGAPSVAAQSSGDPSAVTSEPRAVPSNATAPSPDRAGRQARPQFSARVERLDRAMRRSMRGVSWRPGCPVPLRELRLITVRYTTFRGGSRSGRLVMRRDVARDIVRVFRNLYRARYPIRRMELVEAYGGSDRRSMAANNTSGFNCRGVPGSASWSQHAYGLAIDINPVQNPYLPTPGDIQPRRGRRFVDRNWRHPAVIHDGDAVVRAFDRVGWGWGGRWSSLKDWQHFSRDGG